MVPLVRSLQARSHDVLWASGPDAEPAVRAAGVPFAKAGLRTGEGVQEFWRRNPEARALPPDQLPDLMFGKMCGAVAAPAMLADLLPVVREWRPELVLFDAASLAGPVIAAMVGVPGVNKSFGALLPAQRVAGASDEVAPIWRALGLEPRPYAGCYDGLYLDIYPPGLQPALPDYVGRSLALRPVPYDVADGPEPTDLPIPEGSADLPLVYLTMGTVFTSTAVLRPAVDALAALRARLLVTVGPGGDPAELGDQPAHVRVERYVPQTHILRHSQVVVSHGGSGTVLAALALGCRSCACRRALTSSSTQGPSYEQARAWRCTRPKPSRRRSRTLRLGCWPRRRFVSGPQSRPTRLLRCLAPTRSPKPSRFCRSSIARSARALLIRSAFIVDPHVSTFTARLTIWTVG